MAGFLTMWASGVVVAVIIGSIIEMILPESNNKKYVKTVIGIFILFTIISPVIVKFSGGIDLKSIVDFEQYSANTTMVSAANVITDNDIIKIYKDNISKEITNELEQNGFKVKKLELQVSTAEKNYGDIIEIRLKVEEGNNSVENIEKIAINISENSEKTKEISEKHKNKIKDILNTTYSISKDKIYVN